MKLFIADLKKIIKSPESLLTFKNELTKADQTRFDSFSNQTRALQFLASRKIIKEHICPDYKTLKSGKVTIKGGFVSISHSRNLVVVAFSENPIGVDIEAADRRIDYKKIAERMKFENCNTPCDFFKCWTAYEADYKLGKTKERIHHTHLYREGFLICLASTDTSAAKIIPIFLNV